MLRVVLLEHLIQLRENGLLHKKGHGSAAWAVVSEAGAKDFLFWISKNKATVGLLEDCNAAQVIVIIQFARCIADKPVLPVWIWDESNLYLSDADWIRVWLSLGQIENILVHIHLGVMNKAL